MAASWSNALRLPIVDLVITDPLVRVGYASIPTLLDGPQDWVYETGALLFFLGRLNPSAEEHQFILQLDLGGRPQAAIREIVVPRRYEALVSTWHTWVREGDLIFRTDATGDDGRLPLFPWSPPTSAL